MAADTKDVDAVSGTATTGHEWDGIKELNTPMPRWWLYLFYACIVWSIGYWVVYPAWPTATSYTAGLFGWSSREAVVADLAGLKTIRGPMAEKLAGASLTAIAADPLLIEFARAQGRPAFADNCAPCHGSGGAGGRGYPNLNDDDWLWGGKLDAIAQTIKVGIRSTDPDTRSGNAGMPAFGRDKLLTPAEIGTVADFVRSLSGLPADGKPDLAAGKKLFADNCAACHGDDGKGNREVGAPNLADRIWLYGSDKATIVEGLINGRTGVMPAWGARLDASTQKALAVYVHSLGGGEK
jgi:cytochrome c oxidase cbb3-type subunit 3